MDILASFDTTLNRHARADGKNQKQMHAFMSGEKENEYNPC